MTDGMRSTCDTHARYNRDCTGCRVRRREYQAAYRSGPKPAQRRRTSDPPDLAGAPPRVAAPKVAPVAEELAAQLGRLRRMEANDSVYREMLAAADAHHG